MTWLSRLLPQRDRIRPRAERRRDLNAKQRRRIAALEGLETRTVLSDVTTNPLFIQGALTITADRFNNAFSIEEFKENGVSKVTITSLDAQTLINGGTAWTSLGGVSSITVNFKDGTVADNDRVELFGPGVDTVQATKNVTFKLGKTNLDLQVFDINNPGAFKLSTKGRLDLVMTDSKWQSMDITQEGCCPAHIDILNTTVTGKVNIKEGWGDGSYINVDNSAFGETVLQQYYGKQFKGKNCEGDNNWISVTNSTALDLTIDQCGPSQYPGTYYSGENNTVTVENLGLGQSQRSYEGLYVCQGDGANNDVSITGVYVFGRPNLRYAPTTGILVEQGCGANDDVDISDVIVPGSVVVYQGCGIPCDVNPETGEYIITPSGANVTVEITGVTAGAPGSFAAGEIAIYQGDGRNSDASITDSSTYELGISISQGDLEQDDALISGVTSGAYISIVQGRAAYDWSLKPTDFHAPDTAEISDSTAEGSVTITQCDIPWPLIAIPDTNPVQYYSWPGNTALISGVDVTGGYYGVCIYQGDKDGDDALIENVTTTGYICIEQGDGDEDTAAIVDSTTYDTADDDKKLHDHHVWIEQGDGNGDSASVSGVDADGYICIWQGDGDFDYAEIVDSLAWSDLCIYQGDGDEDEALISNTEATHGDVIVEQGDGGDTDDPDCIGDVITLDTVTALKGDVWLTQGDGNFDEIHVYGLVAGTFELQPGGWYKEWDGNLYIVQGDGFGDLVDIDGGTSVNNAYIYQGVSEPFDGCYELEDCRQNDIVQIDNTEITSDLEIIQGCPWVVGEDGQARRVEKAVGYYQIEIGLEGAVYAYGYTFICQAGQSNSVVMYDFTTTWLDVWQGFGGGAYAEVGNTTVEYGSDVFYYNFNAGDGGNTFVDAGGNINVTFSEHYNVVPDFPWWDFIGDVEE